MKLIKRANCRPTEFGGHGLTGLRAFLLDKAMIHIFIYPGGSAKSQTFHESFKSNMKQLE